VNGPPRRSDDSTAILALTNRLVDTGVAPLKASELWRVVDVVPEPGGLLGLDAAALATATGGCGVDPERLARLLDTGIGLAVRLDGLYERGIGALTAADDEYPARLRARLGAAAPPVLYYAGDAGLLAADGVGVVGSREVGPEVTDLTVEVGQHVAAAGLAVVSGAARGVDSIAMGAALEAGGSVVGVLAEPLEQSIGMRGNRAAVMSGQACLCTPYRPDAVFTAGGALGRNKIVYGLSRVTLVVTCVEGAGGTWAGATEALQRGFGHVAVWTGADAGPGNAALASAGATAVETLTQLP